MLRKIDLDWTHEVRIESSRMPIQKHRSRLSRSLISGVRFFRSSKSVCSWPRWITQGEHLVVCPPDLDRTMFLVGRALLHVEDADVQECPSYKVYGSVKC